MNKSSQSIVKNMISLTSGQIINLALNFLSITIAARYLGVTSFGQFGYLLAIVVMVSKIIDLGLAPVIFRELSVDKSKFYLLNSALSLRIVSYAIVTLLFNIVIYFVGFTNTEILLCNALIFNSIISAKFICVRELLEVPFKVNLKMHYPMIITNLDNLILLIGVFFIPYFDNKLSYFIIIYMLANIPGFFLMFVYLNKVFNYKFHFNFKTTKFLLKESMPIYGYILLDSLYQQIDVVILKSLSSYYSAGIYSISLRLVMPLLIFPTAIIHTIFPKISQNSSPLSKNNDLIINLVFKILFVFAASISIIFVFKSTDFIRMIFGNNYYEAAGITSLLLFTQIFVFYNFFVINLMIAFNKQVWDFLYSIIVFVIYLISCFILIPIYSVWGVGIAKIITGFIGFILTTSLLYKFSKKFYIFNLNVIVWTFINLASMFILSQLNVYLYVFCSVIVLIILTLITGVFNEFELKYLFDMLHLPGLLKFVLRFSYFKSTDNRE